MSDFQNAGRSLVVAKNGMAATSHPLASQVAISVLRDGGNAADAAIAAAVLLGVCEPQMTGLGGDCFVLVKPAGEERVHGINGSGRAAAGVNAAALRAKGHSVIDEHSADAITIPGAVDAFAKLSADWGRKSLGDVLQPAIKYFREGVPVAPRVAFDYEASSDNLKGAARDKFLKDDRALQVGDDLRLPDQAATLERIAEEGRDGFYTGSVAEDMVETLQALGGTHTLEDFRTCKTDDVEPVSGDYKGHDLIELPPNGQGAAAILLCKILSHFDLASLDPYGADRVHIEAEATKLAYDARNRFISDADHMTRLDHMLSDETASRLAALIDPHMAMEGPAAASEAVHRDTIYLTVVDKDRMAVSLIYSIFHSFGSGIVAPKSGILFHNRGAGFTLEEGHPNELGPGKRPMHTIIPAMLAREGRVMMPFGVMGGQYQAAGHARFVTNLVDFGMDAQTAMDGPRAFAEAGELRLERGYSADVRKALMAKGHKVMDADGPIGGSQSIQIDNERGILTGASDPRKDGCALGY